jgi:hypothetical protein
MRINFTEISEPDALAAGQLPLFFISFHFALSAFVLRLSIHLGRGLAGWPGGCASVSHATRPLAGISNASHNQFVFTAKEGVSVSLRVRKLSKQTGTLPKQVFLQSALPSFSLYLLNGSAVLCFAFDVARRAWCHLRIRPGRWKCRGFGFL